MRLYLQQQLETCMPRTRSSPRLRALTRLSSNSPENWTCNRRNCGPNAGCEKQTSSQTLRRFYRHVIHYALHAMHKNTNSDCAETSERRFVWSTKANQNSIPIGMKCGRLDRRTREAEGSNPQENKIEPWALPPSKDEWGTNFTLSHSTDRKSR